MVNPLARRNNQPPTTEPKTAIDRLERVALAGIAEWGTFSHDRVEWEHLMDLGIRGCYHLRECPIFYIQEWARTFHFEIEITDQLITVRDPSFTPKPRRAIVVQRSLFE